ncbi:unnamed protein product, partial [Gulo gulo]
MLPICCLAGPLLSREELPECWVVPRHTPPRKPHGTSLCRARDAFQTARFPCIFLLESHRTPERQLGDQAAEPADLLTDQGVERVPLLQDVPIQLLQLSQEDALLLL